MAERTGQPDRRGTTETTEITGIIERAGNIVTTEIQDPTITFVIIETIATRETIEADKILRGDREEGMEEEAIISTTEGRIELLKKRIPTLSSADRSRECEKPIQKRPRKCRMILRRKSSSTANRNKSRRLNKSSEKHVLIF